MNNEINTNSNKKSATFLVAGGDCRQNFLAAKLANLGYRVYTLGLSDEYSDEKCIALNSLSALPYSPDAIILPIVVSSDCKTINAPFYSGEILISDLCKSVRTDTLIIGGMIDSELRGIFKQQGLECIDYFHREELIIANCVPTAEGALQIVMENTPFTVSASDVLILGFGRVAKATARIFSALGARVHIAARKRSDLAYAKTLCYAPVAIGELSEKLPHFDVIINTVPAKILDREHLLCVDKNALIVDLASKPGGVDFDCGSELGLKVIWALSLPGKVAPVTSGEIIADTVINIYNEHLQNSQRKDDINERNP